MADEIKEYETIWFPGVYGGRNDEPWTNTVASYFPKPPHGDYEIVELIQKRAEEDGNWAIDNGFVGNNEAKMRRMIAWVQGDDNILQCIEHVLKNGEGEKRTVDWVCRDLANASKAIFSSM